MSIYTCVKKEVVEVLNRDLFCGTYVLRMEPIYAEVSEQEWYDAMERGEPIDQVYEVAEQQVRYWIWGLDINTGIKFEILDNGDLFTANRTDAIYFAEFLIAQYGDEFYKEHVSHDNDCYWDPCLQQWIGIALDSGAMYTPATSYGDQLLDDDGFPVGLQRYCDEQQGDIVDDYDYDDNDDVDRYGSDGRHIEGYEGDPDVIEYLDSFDCQDGSWDVVRLLSDGTTDMIKLYYDPLYVGHDAHVQLWASLQCSWNDIPF